MSAVVGIIGGMGPLSTIELMKKIIDNTPVKIEQDHIRMLIDNRPQIPDRTEYLLGNGLSPVPMLRNSARLLEKWGAELLAIACNTAHVFIGAIEQSVNIPVLDMLEILARDLQDDLADGNEILLLATSGALKSGIFQQYLQNFKLRIPENIVQQDLIMDIIYGKDGIKTTKNFDQSRKRITQYISDLHLNPETVILAGCTEIGLVLDGIGTEQRIINPLDHLALEIVRAAVQ
jgi:aspartate racemase